jgi:hypothetical protein
MSGQRDEPSNLVARWLGIGSTMAQAYSDKRGNLRDGRATTDQNHERLRLAHADRESAVRDLECHAQAGRLTIDEFGERMECAMGAVTFGDLVPVFDDLPRLPAGANSRRYAWRSLFRHLMIYLMVNALIFIAVMLLGSEALLADEVYWPAWTLFAWGAGVVEHARQVGGEAGRR